MEGSGAAAAFSVQVDHPARTAVVARVHGDLDAMTAPRLRDTIADHVTTTQRQLIIDLDGVRFLGTAGLAVLIDARQARPDLQIVCSNPRPLRTLEIAGLPSWFHVTPSVTAALADDATSEAPERAGRTVTVRARHAPARFWGSPGGRPDRTSGPGETVPQSGRG